MDNINPFLASLIHGEHSSQILGSIQREELLAQIRGL
jgi:hypothetical protein